MKSYEVTPKTERWMHNPLFHFLLIPSAADSQTVTHCTVFCKTALCQGICNSYNSDSLLHSEGNMFPQKISIFSHSDIMLYSGDSTVTSSGHRT
jgi:hypothetical protein